MLEDHTGFIVAAYAVAAVVVVVLIAWVALDHRAQRRALAAFEAAEREPAKRRT